MEKYRMFGHIKNAMDELESSSQLLVDLFKI
jgi:hypothetical protein